MVEGSLEVELPAIRTDQKQRWAESEKRRRSKKRKSAKAAGAEPAGQMRDEKLHAVVARSTLRSQNVRNAPGSDHFWKLR